MLMKVRELVPRLFRFLHLFLPIYTVLGGQNHPVSRRNTAGRSFRVLAVLPHHPTTETQLTSEFQIVYLDDSMLGSNIGDIRDDLQVVEKVGEEIGLQLNEEKTEAICCSQETRESLLIYLPEALVVETKQATLLSPPIGGVLAISTTLREKIDAL